LVDEPPELAGLLHSGDRRTLARRRAEAHMDAARRSLPADLPT
jgi:hypothetical protein